MTQDYFRNRTRDMLLGKKFIQDRTHLIRSDRLHDCSEGTWRQLLRRNIVARNNETRLSWTQLLHLRDQQFPAHLRHLQIGDHSSATCVVGYEPIPSFRAITTHFVNASEGVEISTDDLADHHAVVNNKNGA
jgi:hypothetical protein